MIVLQAPHNLIQATTLLPDPDYEDGEGLSVNLDVKTTMDGSLYTYVKSSDRRVLTMTFILHRQKALELKAFLEAYIGEEVRMTITYKDEVWKGHVINDPIEFENLDRSEQQSFNLTFEGEQLV